MTTANVSAPDFSTTDGSPDVIQHRSRWFINMGRPGFNCLANNRNGFETEAAARAAMNRRTRPIQKDGTPARATWLAARELLALAELLKEQASDLSLQAEQPGVHWGHAGTAQSMALAVRHLVAQNYYHRAGNSERAALEMVAEDVAHKIARM
jgi:hypothetical protein